MSYLWSKLIEATHIKHVIGHLFQLIFMYNVDQETKEVIDAFDWYILPSANPDGYEYSWKTVLDIYLMITLHNSFSYIISVNAYLGYILRNSLLTKYLRGPQILIWPSETLYILLLCTKVSYLSMLIVSNVQIIFLSIPSNYHDKT